MKDKIKGSECEGKSVMIVKIKLGRKIVLNVCLFGRVRLHLRTQESRNGVHSQNPHLSFLLVKADGPLQTHFLMFCFPAACMAKMTRRALAIGCVILNEMLAALNACLRHALEFNFIYGSVSKGRNSKETDREQKVSSTAHRT